MFMIPIMMRFNKLKGHSKVKDEPNVTWRMIILRSLHMVLLREVMTRGHSKVKDEPNDTFEKLKETENIQY